MLSVRVDGEPATFTLEHANESSKDAYGDLSSVDVGELYKSARSSALTPGLTIKLPESQVRDQDSEREDRISVDISYTVSLTDSGGLFSRNGYVMTLDTVGSAPGWMPCFDSPQALIRNFEIHIIVSHNLSAICSGELKAVRKSAQMSGWNTYHYQMPYPCAPGDVAFVVGRLKCDSASMVSSLESGNTSVLNQFIPYKQVSDDIDYVFSFNRFVLDFFADILGVLPTPTINVVYLPEDVMPGPLLSGVGFLAISKRDIPSPTCVEGSQDLRYRLAFAFAKQWFGYLVRPATFNDLWIVRGLQHWLGDQFMQAHIGKTEYIYRKWQRHNAVAQMDNGEAPPLAFHGWRPDGCPWGVFFGTEDSDPSEFFSKKSAVVVSMIENRAGDQLFKKQVETVVRSVGTVTGSEGSEQSTHVGMVDSKEFLMDLSKAGDFRAEVNPFMERWIFGSGAPIVSVGVQYQKRGCMLDVGLKQLGSEASFNSSLASEMEASKEKVGISGIIKVSVQEGSGVRVDHPLHLGTKGYLFQTVKVNPEVKKIAGKRGRKKKSEEALVDAKKAALQNAQHPVQYVRLDSTNEFLGQKFVHQPIRMVVNKLKNSRQVDAQAEAVRELLKAAHASMTPLQTLAEALEDTSMHWAIRCDAATALSQIHHEENGCVGPGVLMAYYKKQFWDSAEDTPIRIQFASIEEYWVTKAVIAALGKSKTSNGYTDFEVISFILENTDRFWNQELHIQTSHLLATFVEALGNLRCDKNEEQLVEFLHEKVFEKVVWYLKMDLSVGKGDFAIGKACLTSLVSMTCSGSCPKPLVLKVGDLLYRYCNDRDLPRCMIETGCKAVVRFKTAWQGCESSISWCLDMLQQTERMGLRFIRDLWTELATCIYPTRLSLEAIQRLCDMMAKADVDVDLKHLAFVVIAVSTKTSIYICETFADVKPSLIKLNAVTAVTHQKEVDSLPQDASGPQVKVEENVPKKLKLKLKT